MGDLSFPQRLLLKMLQLGAKGLPSGKKAASSIPSAAELGFGIPTTMSILKGIVTWSGENAQAFVNEGYAGNDIVYSVVNMITDKAKMAPWGIYIEKDKNIAKLYQSKLKAISSVKSVDLLKNINWKELRELKSKAYEPYDKDPWLNSLLQYPDKDGGTSWSELIEALCAFRLITGNAYVYAPQIAVGRDAKKPNFMMALPSQWMSIIADLNALYARAVAYRLYMGAGIGWPIAKEEIVHIAKFNPQWNASGQQLYGMSPLQSARKRITRINESLTASVANLQNGGPSGVLSLDYIEGMDFTVAQTQVTQLRQKLVEYSGAANKNRIATSGYPVKWQDIGLSNVDLEILAGEKHDMRFICNTYNVPSTLLNDPDAKNENNQIAAEKALTVRAAIPELIAIRDALNLQAETSWGLKGVVFDFDLSVYPELQEDKKTQAEFLDISMMTLRQRYAALDIEVDPAISEELLNSIIYRGNIIQEPGMTDPFIDPYNQTGK